MKDVRAVIADDENLLRQSLRALLAETWPELVICGEAGNGREAVELISAHRPQIAFLDIRMPGLSGLEVAEAIGDFCHVVFVTAFDHYALQAFEREALDYLLKPVSLERLRKTVTRLKEKIATAPPRLPPDAAEGAAASIKRSHGGGGPATDPVSAGPAGGRRPAGPRG